MKEQEKPQFGLTVGVGLVIGIAVGAALDNVGMGVALGLIFGAGIGATRSKQDNADRPDEKGNGGGAGT